VGTDCKRILFFCLSFLFNYRILYYFGTAEGRNAKILFPAGALMTLFCYRQPQSFGIRLKNWLDYITLWCLGGLFDN